MIWFIKNQQRKPETVSEIDDGMNVFHQDLAAGLKKALAGELETLLLELLIPPLDYEAHGLRQAMAVS